VLLYNVDRQLNNYSNIYMRKVITYCIDEGGAVYSRVGSEIAFPEIQYESMTPENSFTPAPSVLTKGSIHDLSSQWDCLTWTKKIPVAIKNIHRAFWGMKALPIK
jgi:hypothetical protein